MNDFGFTLATAPLLPWAAIAAFGGVALLVLAFGAWRRARGTAWRLAAIAVLLLILANPSLVEEQREPQRDVAAVVVDESPSMRIGERRRYAEEALQQVTERLQQFRDLDVRVVRAGAPDPNAALLDKGTELYSALIRAVADVPRQRLAGAVMITDGQVHDMPPPDRLAFEAPLHALLTGVPGEADRRLIVKDAPTFGLVGKELKFTVRVEDLPGAASGAQVRLTIRKDGGSTVGAPGGAASPGTMPDEGNGKSSGRPVGLTTVRAIPVGRDVPVAVTIDHGGPNVFELQVEPGPHSLTPDNKRAAFVVNGVRDRLKVLLISGEPHQGERTWRNILKSDPSVDLIHFTILRPPEKQDGTPIRELSLIAFPIRELFDVKIDEFDLIIFDRYQRRNVLPPAYLDNIARYVRKGGALLEAAGPAFGTPLSLYRTPLGSVLPAEPTGNISEDGFVPEVNDVGRRHPVTADLPGAPADPKQQPSWGRWFREVQAEAHRGDTVMTGFGKWPLLVLDRVGEGRVAQLLSDEMWLWTRGFEGGGPQAELLRRMVYWLMKEPDLEENDLRAVVEGNRLVVIRQSLTPADGPVEVTGPDGKTVTLPLAPETGGRSVGSMPVSESGLYRVVDPRAQGSRGSALETGVKLAAAGDLPAGIAAATATPRTALAAAGALNPIELSDVRATDEKLKPDTEATGGGIYWVGPGTVPDARRVAPDRAASGRNWMGFRANGDYIVTGAKEIPLMPGLAALLLALGTFLLAWRREGR